LSNSTLTGNFAAYAGGGVFQHFVGTANVKGTLIAQNSGGSIVGGPDVYGPFASQGFNLIGKKDGSTGFTAATDKKGTIAARLIRSSISKDCATMADRL
jgi:hypothetical protein